MRNSGLFCLGPLLVLIALLSTAQAFGVSARSFIYSPAKQAAKPKLILISGCPGTGKSTFGMSVSLDQGILKCISTDTVRAVMRSFVPERISPALHRSSYAAVGEDDDPVRSWRETCTVLETSVAGLVDDAINRGVSLVVEGVHVVPSQELIEKWEASGGVALGCLLTVRDPETHKSLLLRRGFITGKGSPEQKKIKSYDRVRLIQDEMIRLATESKWLMIEQKVEPDPLEIVASKLFDEECRVPEMPINKQHDANGDTNAQNGVKDDHDAVLPELDTDEKSLLDI